MNLMKHGQLACMTDARALTAGLLSSPSWELFSKGGVYTEELICTDDPELLFFSSATEWVGVSHRPKAVLTSHCCFAIGQMIIPGLSYGIHNWRLLQIAGSAPVFALFFYIW